MATLSVKENKLNDLQMSLLRLFNRPMTNEQILNLKRVLVKHYSAQLRTELEKVVSEKGYTQDDFDEMLNQDS